MLTEKDYCDYKLVLELKELGYDYIRREGLIHLYDAQKWLREEKETYVTIIPEYNEFGPIKGVKYRLEVAHWKDDEFGYETIEWLDEECPHTIITFDSYEEALSEGIKEAVKILKDEQTN